MTDQITCFSQVWTNPMMLAPGALITAAGVTQGGTSQATPHVAGGVAVLFDASPSASISSVESALRSSGPLISDSLVGQSYHRLDLPASISALGVTTTTTTTTTPPPGACTIDGTGTGEVIIGTSGDDVICGEGGNDVLVTGGGNDSIIGGDGFDFVSLEPASGGGTIDLGAGTGTAPGLSATLQEIEGGIGSVFADHLIGNGAGNDFLGMGGDDVIEGGGGFDFVRFDFATKRIRVDLGQGLATGEGADALTSMEAFLGGPKDDAASGDGKSNVLVGSKGEDVLKGLGKPDALVGGPGADDLFGGGGDDNLQGGPGPDSCDVGPGGGSISSC